jgi:hypothetical protein
MKNRPVGDELFRANGRKDRRTGSYDEADSRLSYFFEGQIEFIYLRNINRLSLQCLEIVFPERYGITYPIECR